MKLRSSRFGTRLLLTSVLLAGLVSRGGVFAAEAPSVQVTDRAQIHKTEVNGFVHPGIGLTKEMLEDARAQVLAGTATTPVALGEVRAAGKRPMPATDWARGLRITEGESFE